MGAFIFRQPNGLLGRFSTITDYPTHHNMTDNEYIELCAQRAREEAIDNLSRKNFVKPYQACLDAFVPDNMSQEDFDQLCKKMETEDKARTRRNMIDNFLSLVFYDYRNGKDLMFIKREFNPSFIDFASHWKDPSDAGDLASLISSMKKAEIQVVGIEVGSEGINSLSLGTHDNIALSPLVFFIVQYAKENEIEYIHSVSYTADTDSITITFS